MTALRFFRRLFFFFMFLGIIDALVIKKFPSYEKPGFDKYYRFSKGQEISVLPGYVDHIKKTKKAFPGKKILVFLGSSPSYGHKIKNPANTYPYALEQHLKKQWKIYNLSSDGQLLSDQFYILKSLIRRGDVFVFQMNYHTFNPDSLRGVKLRHPELPETLGVAVDHQEAGVLQRRPSPYLSLNHDIRNFLKNRWALYGERENVSWLFLGGTPEHYLFDLYERAKHGRQKQDLLDSVFLSFEELSPVMQGMIVRRYGEKSRFRLTPDNSELFFLKRTVKILRDNRKKAVFFMTPLNCFAIENYNLLRRAEYKKNVELISKPVQQSGFLFLDYTFQCKVPSQYFFDISHSLDKGGHLFGRILFGDTQNYLGITQ